MLSELNSLNLKLCSKQYTKKFVLYLIVVPEPSNGWRHNYSTKTWQVDWANEQSMDKTYGQNFGGNKPISSIQHHLLVKISNN
jgi:hypothetical protein